MINIVGFLVVIGAIVAGYLWEGGALQVLFQPAEFLIIGGAAVGALLIANPPQVLKDILQQLGRVTKTGPSKKDYVDLLVMLYELLTLARKDGLVALESHVEAPKKSVIIKKYPSFLSNHHAVIFMADTMRLIISGAGIESYDLEALMDIDLETHHEETSRPSRVLGVTADSLPGLGIVAAVLGIVITMGAIDGPASEIGEKVAAALVGTFLGVLLSYGFVQPLSNNLAGKNAEFGRYFLALKQVLLAFHKGCLPAIAVEFARRSIFSDVRPEFTELEKACRASRPSAT